MGFWYHLPMPELPAGGRSVRLVEWLADEGDWLRVGTDVLAVVADGEPFVVMANGDGVLREKLFPSGAELTAGMPFAVISADGKSSERESMLSGAAGANPAVAWPGQESAWPLRPSGVTRIRWHQNSEAVAQAELLASPILLRRRARFAFWKKLVPVRLRKPLERMRRISP